MTSKSPIKSVQTAFEIVEFVLENRGSTVTEVGNTLDMPLSTSHNYLQSLVATGFLVKHQQSYHISSRFLEVGNRKRYQTKLLTTALSPLQAFADETGEYASLMVEECGLGVIYAMEKGKEAEQVNIKETYPGIRTHLHTTAPGKAILAEYSDERIQEIINERGLTAKTTRTITEEEELFDNIETIRGKGYAVDDEERFDGMRGIGVAIYSEIDDLQGAISIYGPTHKIDNEAINDDLPKRVLEVANVIQVSLTYS